MLTKEEIQPAFDYADGLISWVEFLRRVDGEEPRPSCAANAADREWVRRNALDMCRKHGVDPPDGLGGVNGPCAPGGL